MENPFRVKSEINKPEYKANSVPENKVYYLVVVAEGDKEEPMYLNGIKGMYGSNNVQLEVLNEKMSEDDKKRSHPKHRLNYLLNYINEMNPEYLKVYKDKPWLICDRDKQSFKEKQYDEVLAMCEASRVELIISNPAFQLWLLLHFRSDISDLELDANEKSKISINKIEEVMRAEKLVPGYKHGTLNFEQFQDNVDDAIRNSSQFSKDPHVLKNAIGTNFDVIVSLIKSVSNNKSIS